MIYVSRLAVLMTGLSIVVASPLFGGVSPSGYEQAFADQDNGDGGGGASQISDGNLRGSYSDDGHSGGNGDSSGHGGGDGNSGGHGGEDDNGGGSSKGAAASALGALNATHASATAFAHANRHSRVGKIEAYRVADAAFERALAAACQTSTACFAAHAAYKAAPTAANRAAFHSAKSTVIEASTSLQRLQHAAIAALNAAASKRPVTASTRAALDPLLVARLRYPR